MTKVFRTISGKRGKRSDKTLRIGPNGTSNCCPECQTLGCLPQDCSICDPTRFISVNGAQLKSIPFDAGAGPIIYSIPTGAAAELGCFEQVANTHYVHFIGLGHSRTFTGGGPLIPNGTFLDVKASLRCIDTHPTFWPFPPAWQVEVALIISVRGPLNITDLTLTLVASRSIQSGERCFPTGQYPIIRWTTQRLGVADPNTVIIPSFITVS